MSQLKVIIVGGVAAGMSAATRLRRLREDVSIVVLERGPYVSFANCGLPYLVGGEIDSVDKVLLQTPTSLQAGFDLDVRPGHEVVGLNAAAKSVQVRTQADQYELSYDYLILSPGAQAVQPPIPGLDHPRVHSLRTVNDATAVIDRVDAGA
ncbi:MAG: FAD-dependent oxidoreductase, partial [Micrococcales bacterium]|nr:FAD-dependent oxidoreductase [Micrococcales bacterium]